MFQIKNISRLISVISCVLALYGCALNNKSTAINDNLPKRPDTQQTQIGVVKGSNDSGVKTITTPNGAVIDLPKELTSTESKLSERSIFFALDSYQIDENGQGLVNAHSIYLNKNKAFNVQLHGHADERGSSEYNLALGQKRAETVKRSLQLLGVSEDRLEAVSFGKEKPRNPGHNEVAWAENRRVDIKYAGEN